MTANEIQLIQMAIPLVEELIPVLAGLFQKHAPQAGQSIEAMDTAKANFAAEAADPIKDALAKAIAIPPPVEKPRPAGVWFEGSTPKAHG